MYWIIDRYKVAVSVWRPWMCFWLGCTKYYSLDYQWSWACLEDVESYSLVEKNVTSLACRTYFLCRTFPPCATTLQQIFWYLANWAYWPCCLRSWVVDMVRVWRLGIQRLYVGSSTGNLRWELMLGVISCSQWKGCDYFLFNQHTRFTHDPFLRLWMHWRLVVVL